jgi:CheY-like chemotaxis protein
MSYVLIVEDDATVAEAIADMVDQLDYEARIVHDPRAAIQAIHKTRPTLILLDLNIPGIDGMELLRYVKREPISRDTPVVFVTVEDDPRTIEQARKIGAMDYLVKPVDIDRLKQVLDRLSAEAEKKSVAEAEEEPSDEAKEKPVAEAEAKPADEAEEKPVDEAEEEPADEAKAKPSDEAKAEAEPPEPPRKDTEGKAKPEPEEKA